MSLGNVDTSFRVGATGRLGWHLPEDFGVQTIHSLAVPDGGRRLADSSWRVGFYFFAGAEASALLYTTFLDGNLFRESHHVERKPFVVELKGGMALVVNRVEIAAMVVYRTEEFAGQHQGDRYTSLLLKYQF